MLKIEDLADICREHAESLTATTAAFSLRGTDFSPKNGPALMGVVNLSPDSWYRESVCLSTEAAIQRGRKLHSEGARIIDIGAESTLPNASLVTEDTQKKRLLPVIRELSRTGILASAETYQPEVTRACLEAGAAILNLTGTLGTEEHYRMAADHDAGVIICYVQGTNVREVGNLNLATDHTQTLLDHFRRETDLALACGVKALWIDPGMGFYYRNLMDSKERVHYQMQTFLNTFRLRTLGWPVCHALPHAFEYFGEEVRSAEPFFAVMALLGKTELLRTHEVARVRGVIETMKAWQ